MEIRESTDIGNWKCGRVLLWNVRCEAVRRSEPCFGEESYVCLSMIGHSYAWLIFVFFGNIDCTFQKLRLKMYDLFLESRWRKRG